MLAFASIDTTLIDIGMQPRRDDANGSGAQNQPGSDSSATSSRISTAGYPLMPTTWVGNAVQLLLDDPKDAIDTGRPIGAEKVD